MKFCRCSIIGRTILVKYRASRKVLTQVGMAIRRRERVRRMVPPNSHPHKIIAPIPATIHCGKNSKPIPAPTGTNTSRKMIIYVYLFASDQVTDDLRRILVKIRRKEPKKMKMCIGFYIA